MKPFKFTQHFNREEAQQWKQYCATEVGTANHYKPKNYRDICYKYGRIYEGINRRIMGGKNND